MKVELSDSSMRRFEMVSSGTGKHTIVKVKKQHYGTTYTLKNIKWSKYKFVNKLIRLWIIVRYM